MTLVLKLDLDMVRMYHHTKCEVSMSRHSKISARTDSMKTFQVQKLQWDEQTDAQTHRQYEKVTLMHTRAVVIGATIRLF